MSEKCIWESNMHFRIWLFDQWPRVQKFCLFPGLNVILNLGFWMWSQTLKPIAIATKLMLWETKICFFKRLCLLFKSNTVCWANRESLVHWCSLVKCFIDRHKNLKNNVDITINILKAACCGETYMAKLYRSALPSALNSGSLVYGATAFKQKTNDTTFLCMFNSVSAQKGALWS